MAIDGDSDALLKGAQAGDGEALDALLVRHMPLLEAYVRLRAGPRIRAKEDTVDLVQSVCCDIIQNPGDFEYQGEAAFRHWLSKRVLHKVINKNRHYRAQKRDVAREADKRVADDKPASVATCYATMCTPSRLAMGKEAVVKFESAFDQLKEEYREAITLYRIVGMSYADIAAEMGKSEGAVRNLVYRGLARLASLLDEEGRES